VNSETVKVNKLSLEEDRLLLAGCFSGDRDAHETLVRQFSDLVYRVIQHTFSVKDISYTRYDLEDLHNGIFLRLFENRCKKLKQYKGKNGCSLASWIRIIAVRTVIDYLRKESVDALNRSKTAAPLEVIDYVEAEEPEPWVAIDKEDQWHMIQDSMKELRPRDKLFLKLHFLERISIGEVANIMGLSESNAHSMKHRALKRLKSKVLSDL
jgi:RNA polymerase sigma-70 factor, ECF subfamily